MESTWCSPESEFFPPFSGQLSVCLPNHCHALPSATSHQPSHETEPRFSELKLLRSLSSTLCSAASPQQFWTSEED